MLQGVSSWVLVMNFRCIILMILAGCTYPAFPQSDKLRDADRDYSSFCDTLKKETGNRDGHLQKEAGNLPLPESLPEWLLDFPQPEGNTLLAAGFSDPGMEEGEAYRLAEIRAKSTLALLSRPYIRSLTHHFSGERSGPNENEYLSRFENGYNIEAFFPDTQAGYEVIRRDFNTFGEACVLMKWDPTHITPEKPDSIRLEMDIYRLERQKTDVFEIAGILEMHVTGIGDGQTFTYSARSMNEGATIQSGFEGQEINIPMFYCRYVSSGHNGGDTGKNLSFGLWKAYIESVAENITLLSGEGNVHFSQVGDDYSGTYRWLSKEFSETNPAFRINGLHIYNNRLAADVDLLTGPF
ncbi:MAG: hypothetical protein JXA03_05770 [Bacteroidales bacterium]|nr:hypothetical protein [Bacteroidales bacterium]